MVRLWRHRSRVPLFSPTVFCGYGIPFRYWIGVDANPVFRGEGVGGWLGLRAVSSSSEPTCRGALHVHVSQIVLTPANSYDHLSIEDRSGLRSQYLSLEAELTWGLEMGPGRWVGELAAAAVPNVPEGAYVFHERLRVVAAPPWIWRTQTGYQIVTGPDDAVQIAMVAELLGIPNRDNMLVFRAGIRGSINLFPDLQLRFRFHPPLLSRDQLGAVGGDSYQVGVRYRFASR